MTGSDDMVSRIAAVILDTASEHPMERGRAVLREMREPTAQMLDRGNTEISDQCDIWDPSGGANSQAPDCGIDVWKAMIDAALDAEPPL